MGKATRSKPQRSAPQRWPEIDATPERLAKGESEIVPAMPVRGERLGHARKFALSRLDRLHKSGALTWVQWYAGDWYRSTHQRCQFPLSVVASYGERTGAGEYPGGFGYGLPRVEAQVRARHDFARARSQWSQDVRAYMDRLLVDDAYDPQTGRAAARNLTKVRNALDVLAQYLRLSHPG